MEILKEILNELFLIRRELEAIRLGMRRRNRGIHIDAKELTEVTSVYAQNELRDIKRKKGSKWAENS